jgi:hypothetical protein
MSGGRENFKDYLECMDREACLELFNKYKNMKREIY